MTGEIWHDRRVDVPRPRLHDEPLERREAHGRVEWSASSDRGDRAAAAELEREETSACGKGGVQLTPASPHGLVRKSMEPITPYPAGRAHPLRERVFGGEPGQRGKERRVESCDLEHLRRSDGSRGFDPLERLRIVQGRKLRQLRQLVQDLRVERNRRGEPITAMNDAMCDGVGAAPEPRQEAREHVPGHEILAGAMLMVELQDAAPGPKAERGELHGSAAAVDRHNLHRTLPRTAVGGTLPAGYGRANANCRSRREQRPKAPEQA